MGNSQKVDNNKVNVHIRSVKFNVLMNMLLTTSSFLFPLITVPYVSRVLSAGGMGYVAFAQSFSSYFSLVSILGMTYYGVRACASVRDNKEELSKTVKELLIILFCSTSVVTIFYAICILTVPKVNEQFELFVIFGVSIWLTSMGVEWFYQALEQYEYITVRNVCFKIVALVLMFIFVRQQKDYIVYGCIVVFAGYGSNILNLLRLHKIVTIRKKQKLNISRHFKPMIWFTIASISSGMYTQIDIVLLGFLGTNTMVGLYQLVSKIKNVLVTAVNSVGTVILPRLSYYRYSNKQDESDQLLSKNLNFVIIVGSAIIALLILCASPIVEILGGQGFKESAVPLRFVGPAVAISAANIVLANHMISNNMEKYWAVINVIGLFLAAMSNFILIPEFGITGSAISISVCEFLMLLMRMYLCRGFIGRIRHYLDPTKIVVSSFGSGVVVYYVGRGLSFRNNGMILISDATMFMMVDILLLLLLRERFMIFLLRQSWVYKRINKITAKKCGR